MRILLPIFLFFAALSLNNHANAQIVLLGENPPYKNMHDGDFSLVWDYWRNASQSPYWATKSVEGDQPMGLHYGSLFSSNELGIAESKILNGNPRYQQVKAGDTWEWDFGADLEYSCNGSITLSLVFGDKERILAQKVRLKGGDQKIEHFAGTFTPGKEETVEGLPFVRVRFYSEQDVKVYLHYVNIRVVDPESVIKLHAKEASGGIALHWTDEGRESACQYAVYRRRGEKQDYEKISESSDSSYLDSQIIHGMDYTYLIIRLQEAKPGTSNTISISKNDAVPPAPPTQIKTEIYNTAIKLSWAKSEDKDVAAYSVYRGDSIGNHTERIGANITKTWYEDDLAPKGVKNTYQVYAHDYSGNRSEASNLAEAKVKAVPGASFSDLILPIPINKKLSSDLWGSENVIPRDPDNGIEHPEWSYWGGRPVADSDGNYHMLVTRWPEGALKGHWEWPNSTVAHVVAREATGPYKVEKDLAYSFKSGLGHNPDIILLNDGRYALYSLIEWEPTIFTSSSMSGPWKREGVLSIDMESVDSSDTRFYQYTRNLSGVQLEDGRVLMVSKFGCMMISDQGLLGPYRVLTKTIQTNQSIPERYRKSNYEDPVMWKDEVQFHLLINAFLDYRAIYLRSPDGINWKCDPGLAYTPEVTHYVDGTQTRWYKLERPHVLQDEYGRATHLSLAAIDVPKKDDYANDKHNSKNIILPLRKHRRLELLNRERIDAGTKQIKIRILSEQDFDAQKDIDILSLRFGASDEVNYGRGSRVHSVKKRGKDLVLEFDGKGNGITGEHFAGKLLGQSITGELITGYVRLKVD